MIGSLFSGIGGLELGLERAGLGPVAWQVEINAFCREVLAKHWPDTVRHEDVRLVGRHNLSNVGVICGGFPCQDVSQAARGRNAGLVGPRSGLWFEYLRVVDELRPAAVVVENVASGAARWLPAVRSGLEGLGYRVRAFALSAREVGAPHIRQRVFAVAHADRHREPALTQHGEVARPAPNAGEMWNGWVAEPRDLRMAHGVSRGLDRLASLGNAVVPQCGEVIGRLVLEGLR